MLNKKRLLAATAVASFLFAAPAQADTLADALAKAYAKNPSIELSRALTRASDERVVQAEAAYGPTVLVEAEHNYTFTNTIVTPTVSAQSDGWATTATLTVSQPLYTSGSLAAGVDRSTAEAMSSREDLRDSSQGLIYEVINAYASLQRDLELYQIATESYQILAEQRELTRRRLDLRDATAPDVDQTENRAELAAARLIQARASLEASAAGYRNLVGEYPQNLSPLPQLPALPGLEQLYTNAEMLNPLIRRSKATEAIARAQVASARSALGPQVSGSVSAGRLPLSPYANERYAEQITAGVSVTLPLYRGGVVSARIREALERSIAAQQNVELTRRNVRQELAVDWNQLQSATASLPRLETAVAAAQRAVNGVQEQERAGIRTLRDVLEVTRDLFTVQTEAISARTEKYVRHAAVLRDAGMLTIDLFIDNAQYDPNSYQPDGGWAAGLPFGPLIEPLDSIIVLDDTRAADIAVENDPEYEPANQLEDPLR